MDLGRRRLAPLAQAADRGRAAPLRALSARDLNARIERRARTHPHWPRDQPTPAPAAMHLGVARRRVDPFVSPMIGGEGLLFSVSCSRVRCAFLSTSISGISTLLDTGTVNWIAQAAADRQLVTHEVTSSTVSAEMESNRLAAIDILKIDVEGYFMEVLKGIAARDFARIANIVMEVDYLPETGIEPDDVEDLLKTM